MIVDHSDDILERILGIEIWLLDQLDDAVVRQIILWTVLDGSDRVALSEDQDRVLEDIRAAFFMEFTTYRV
jgi:hypothetical protein